MGKRLPALNMEPLQQKLKYRFKDKKLCEIALTHRSWANHYGTDTDNERLEFLGDSILGVVIAVWLFKQHQNWSEGQLTKAKSKLVSQSGLLRVEDILQLQNLIRVGQSQGLHPIPASIIAGTVEAVLGAILIDGGYAAASRVIRRLWEPSVQSIQHGGGEIDYKSQLQEWTVKHLHVLPRYAITAERGPAHAREFEVTVKIKAKPYGKSLGKNKKEAEQRAAAVAWEALDTLHGKRATSTKRRASARQKPAPKDTKST